ncbi:MAG TPA: outer membrane beta-barrel protein [Vicinamibacterales bacterium]
MSTSVLIRGLSLTLLLTVAAAVPASAQQEDAPPGPFVVDAHVVLPSFSTGASLAAPLGLRTDQLPSRGLGYEIGVHVYPVRRGRFALGLGASLLNASGDKAPGADADPTDPTIKTQFSAMTPQLSLNFGGARGWSYISGGWGWTRRSTFDASLEDVEGARLTGFSYGGGARWFLSTHVAFSFDLRFYRLPQQQADGIVPYQPGYTMFVGSAGLSFK